MHWAKTKNHSLTVWSNKEEISRFNSTRVEDLNCWILHQEENAIQFYDKGVKAAPSPLLLEKMEKTIGNTGLVLAALGSCLLPACSSPSLLSFASAPPPVPPLSEQRWHRANAPTSVSVPSSITPVSTARPCAFAENLLFNAKELKGATKHRAEMWAESYRFLQLIQPFVFPLPISSSSK